MSAVAYLSYRTLSDYFSDKVLTVRLIEAFVPIALAVITFLIAAKLLKIRELETVYRTLKRKLE
jgi:hypothetical protein